MVIGVDPTGALIGFCEPACPWRLGRIGPGSLYWAQLDTWDVPGADALYAGAIRLPATPIGDGFDIVH